MITTTPQKDEDECEEPMPHSVPRGFLRFLIMSLLRNRELTGSEIMDILEERSNGRWKPSPGSIYPMLESLREDRFIEIASEIGRSKKYRTTKSGLDQFKQISRKKRDMDHKTRLSRLLWLQLLSPSDRVHFHLSGIDAAVELLEDSIEELTASDKKKAEVRVSNLIDKLTAFMKTLQDGE